MIKLNKTQTNCIHKAILFEVAKKETLQKKIDAYKCLNGFVVRFAKKLRKRTRVVLTKHLGGGTYGSVEISITDTSIDIDF